MVIDYVILGNCFVVTEKIVKVVGVEAKFLVFFVAERVLLR